MKYSSHRPLRIAVFEQKHRVENNDQSRNLLTAVAKKLKNFGVEIVPVDFDLDMKDLETVRRSIVDFEAGRSLLADYLENLLPDTLRHVVSRSQSISGSVLMDHYDRAARYRQILGKKMAMFDAIIAPSAAGEAPLGLNYTGSSIYNTLWTFLHAPVLNIPAGTGTAGMPIGLSLVGSRFRDAELLDVGQTIVEILHAEEDESVN